MATYNAFTDILPTPDNPIGYGGQTLATGSGGKAGPGYASVKLEAEYQTAVDKTNSGRLVSRSNAAHSWRVDITYNPMTREEFSPIYSFLLEKQGRLRPFYVTLPQHAASQNAAFSDTLTLAGAAAAGTTYFMVNGHTAGETNIPYPGDLFTITDTSDSNHKKAYKVTRVETNGTYNTGYSQPGTTQLRIHFTPALQRYTYSGATLVFANPKIKVIMSNDVMSYQLKTDNLYVYSLNLEEVQ